MLRPECVALEDPSRLVFANCVVGMLREFGTGAVLHFLEYFARVGISSDLDTRFTWVRIIGDSDVCGRILWERLIHD